MCLCGVYISDNEYRTDLEEEGKCVNVKTEKKVNQTKQTQIKK